MRRPLVLACLFVATPVALVGCACPGVSCLPNLTVEFSEEAPLPDGLEDDGSVRPTFTAEFAIDGIPVLLSCEGGELFRDFSTGSRESAFGGSCDAFGFSLALSGVQDAPSRLHIVVETGGWIKEETNLRATDSDTFNPTGSRWCGARCRSTAFLL